MKNTLQVPVKDIVDVAEKAYDGFVDEAKKKWEKAVFEFWARNKNNRWFWIGKPKWKTIQDVEYHLGKPKKEGDGIVRFTTYWKLFRHTDQGFLYKNISELYENNCNAIITMEIEHYNILRTYDEKD